MPVTKFQKKILKLLSQNRSPDSYVAGATVINRGDDSARYSKDIDFFHDSSVSVQECSAIDIDCLRKNSYDVRVLLEQRGFVRCVIEYSNEDTLRLEWVSDTAFRFFPVIADDDFGYRLHDIDVAVNKCLALANRTEARDVIDILEIDKNILSLASCCWAACGKDPGFTPDLILDCISRNARLTPDILALENLTSAIDPKKVKTQWMESFQRAQLEISKFPIDSIGSLFLDQQGNTVHRPKDFSNLITHQGSVRGSWPFSESL